MREESWRQFALWFDHAEGLKSIHGDVEAMLAVAQHYGLPTDFIDFSLDIDVAAFFATHGSKQAQADYVCLICIQPEH